MLPGVHYSACGDKGARGAHRVDSVVVATTDQAADDPIAEFCRQEKIPCFRGDEQDVLDRFYQAARAHNANTVVRITADCPLIDPAVIDRVVGAVPGRAIAISIQRMRYSIPTGSTWKFLVGRVTRAWREARSRPNGST